MKRVGTTLVSETRNPPFRKDPSLFWNTARPLYNVDGEVVGAIEVIRDITERMLAEEELGRHREKLEELIAERTQELAAAQDELLKSERLAVLGQLTATVSHELRNPLGVIRSSLFYLQKKYQGQDAKIKKHMSRIEEQVEICNKIVGDLLDFTRGRHSQTVEGEINPWLEKILDEITDTGDIEIKKAFTGEALKVFFDSEKLRRVIVNLLDNSLQAIREREQAVQGGSYQPEVEIASKAVKEGVLIRISDNGVGMNEETLRRAVDPLFTTKARGTGLGLAVVQKIIDEHGGTLSIRSRINAGTDVSIQLPGPRASESDG